MANYTGGQAFVAVLERLGVRQCFGMAGFQHLPYYNALLHSDKIRHIAVRDERGGAFMADAYARAGGQVALCDATTGPGATNLVSGVAEAYSASVPMLVYTSSVNRRFVGKGANQELDHRALFRSITKDCVQINDIARIPELTRRAFLTAVDGRPGPVLIDIPEDVCHDVHDFDESDFGDTTPNRFPANRFVPEQARIAAACEALLAARSPVILSGGGIHNSGAWRELRRLAERLNLPVATTISGKGSLPEDHPLSLNVCGRYTRFANDFVSRADVVLVVGCRLGEMSTVRWTLLNPKATIIHIDTDGSALGRNYPVAHPLPGDAKATLDCMLDCLTAMNPTPRPSPAADIARAAAAWRADVSNRTDFDGKPINIAHMLKRLQAVLPRDAIMVADGGFSAHWSSVYWDVNGDEGRHYIANRGQAAIGYGLPGAIGAKLACPDKTVVTLSGDGGLGLSFMELETAVREHIPVILIVVNNMCFGYIKALQHNLYGEVESADLLDVNYAELARIVGAYGCRITEPAQLEAEFTAARSRSIPSVLEVMVTTDVTQMLPGEDNRLKK